MEPRTLSATAIKTFEECEAAFRATYIDQIREASGAAGDLGTAVHDVLEWFVSEWEPANGGDPAALAALTDRFGHHAVKYGLDATMVADGNKMLKDWLKRWNEDTPHMVLSCEVKESFPIKSSDGREIGVTYIWDRGDQHEDGSIEVVDYKTWRRVADGEEMRQLLQVRIYALSAAIRYKDMNPPAIWVTLDQLRTGPVSVKFTREDNKATWNYLRSVYDRILASDGKRETVGDGCRYCVRKADCQTLHRAIDTGNIQKLRANPALAARRLAELKAARNATEALVSELEEFMEELLEEHRAPELQYDGVTVKMTIRKSRKAEYERINRVLPDGRTVSSLADVDAILEDLTLDADIRLQVKALTTTTVSGKATAFFPKK